MFINNRKKFSFKFPLELLFDVVLKVPNLKKFASIYKRSNGNLLESLQQIAGSEKRVKANVYVRKDSPQNSLIVEFGTNTINQTVKIDGKAEEFSLGFLIVNTPSSKQKVTTWYQALTIPVLERELDRLNYKGRIKGLAIKYPFGDNFLVFETTTKIELE